MMSLLESSTSLLAACGGDTVKVFDVSVKSGDPCVLNYSPSPGYHVNSIKWNHTNLVVASAGEDRKISLWRKNGQSIGIVPLSNSNADDDLEESIVSINFSNKSSRYICSGGSGRVVRIWDLQRKRCIKWLSGHTDTITGVMYNCKDEHLASISLKGDLILHNLASGARAADFKDPFGQVLRVLDFSRLSRHILVIAGDDGSIHMVDTIGRAPKVSWLKQHSAPTTGVCFSPSSDKILASVGLDKKLYTFDSAMRKPTSCVPYEAPFSSLTYSDDGNILTAGTTGGLVVFYDVRGKPQPFTILHAFSSSEAVTSLCWQRSKPYVVNESNCTSEIALLGGASEDSILMPDPRPSVSTSSFSTVMSSTSRSSHMVSTSGSMSTASSLPTAEETPIRSSLWRGGSLAKLQAPRGNFNLKDDMDVFSPLVDVQPITPSLSSLWEDHDEEKQESSFLDKKPLTFQNATRRFPFTEADFDAHGLSDWRSSTTSRQDDVLGSQMVCTPVASLKSDSSFSSAPEERVGNAMLEKSNYHQQFLTVSRHLPSTSLATSSTLTNLQDSSSSTIQSTKSVLTNPTFSSLNQQTKAISTNEKSSAYLESSSLNHSSSVSVLLDTKQVTSANFEIPGPVHSVIPRRYTTYADRLITASSLSDGISSSIISPKSKKTGSETREELLSNLLSRQDSTATGNGGLQSINGMETQPLKASGLPSDLLGNSSFSLQLVQRTLEETLGSVQKSIHDDVKNLHIDLLRQFHMQEMVMSNLVNSVLEKHDELIKEVQTLRRENQQLRQLL